MGGGEGEGRLGEKGGKERERLRECEGKLCEWKGWGRLLAGE